MEVIKTQRPADLLARAVELYDATLSSGASKDLRQVDFFDGVVASTPVEVATSAVADLADRMLGFEGQVIDQTELLATLFRARGLVFLISGPFAPGLVDLGNDLLTGFRVTVSPDGSTLTVDCLHLPVAVADIVANWHVTRVRFTWTSMADTGQPVLEWTMTNGRGEALPERLRPLMLTFPLRASILMQMLEAGDTRFKEITVDARRQNAALH